MIRLIIMCIFISLLLYLNYLIGLYYVDSLNLIGIGRFVFWSLHILASTVMITTPIIYRLHPIKKPGFFYNAIQWCGYIIFGIYSILIIFMLVNISGFVLYDYFSDAIISKKYYLKSLLALSSIGITSIVVMFGFFETRKKPQVKKISVSIAHLPIEFEGLKILQMSDIHVGQTIRGNYVEMLVEISNSIKPDIVVLTGDITDGLLSQLADELKAFQNILAPLGKFMVPGNHEYYWGVNDWIKHWRELDFTPLLNEHKIIVKNNSQIVIAGVHDYSVQKMNKNIKSSPKESLKDSPTEAVKILLAHQPRSIYEAHEAGFDLQLSGHTHSGQYFPYNILIYLFQPFVKGLHLYKKTWIYVNQGTGYWGPPNRFGVPPEITLIKLTSMKLIF